MVQRQMDCPVKPGNDEKNYLRSPRLLLFFSVTSVSPW